MLTDNILRLQTVLLPNKEVCSVEELYFHRDNDLYCFDGYFNLFAIDKWRKYTNLDNLFLHIECEGFDRLYIMNKRQSLFEYELKSETDIYDIELPYQDQNYNLVFWFSLHRDTTGKAKLIKAYFYTKTEKSLLNNIEIVADICTFKREEYLYRNICQLKRKIIDNTELDVSTHFNIFVVDNGKTLNNHEKLQSLLRSSEGRIKIFENKNAGGAGGFTRGMIEAINSNDRFSHIVLMDDDAINEPDSIVRLYALLSTLKKEWTGVAVGGAIFREDFPYLLHENGAKIDKGNIILHKKGNDLRKYENAVADYIMGPSGEYEKVSGWWFYCVPLTTARGDNLPLPMFIHVDDIEYGIRNSGMGIIFLNGIGVWHRAFDVTASSMDTYTYTRNFLIMMSVHMSDNIRKIPTFSDIILKRFISYIIRYRYEDVFMLEKAVADFLKGPKYIMNTDPEKILKDISGKGCIFKKIEDYLNRINRREKEIISREIDSFTAERMLDNVLNVEAITNKKYKFTLNGWILPANKCLKAVSINDSPFKLYRCKKIALFEPYSKKVYISQKSYIRLIDSFIILMKIYFSYIFYSKRVAKEFVDAYDEMRSIDFWKNYLGI